MALIAVFVGCCINTANMAISTSHYWIYCHENIYKWLSLASVSCLHQNILILSWLIINSKKKTLIFFNVLCQSVSTVSMGSGVLL